MIHWVGNAAISVLVIVPFIFLALAIGVSPTGIFISGMCIGAAVSMARE